MRVILADYNFTTAFSEGKYQTKVLLHIFIVSVDSYSTVWLLLTSLPYLSPAGLGLPLAAWGVGVSPGVFSTFYGTFRSASGNYPYLLVANAPAWNALLKYFTAFYDPNSCKYNCIVKCFYTLLGMLTYDAALKLSKNVNKLRNTTLSTCTWKPILVGFS